MGGDKAAASGGQVLARRGTAWRDRQRGVDATQRTSRVGAPHRRNPVRHLCLSLSGRHPTVESKHL